MALDGWKIPVFFSPMVETSHGNVFVNDFVYYYHEEFLKLGWILKFFCKVCFTLFFLHNCVYIHVCAVAGGC